MSAKDAEAGSMLVACRLAGLSALEGHYAGLNASAQFGPTRAGLASKPSRHARNHAPLADPAGRLPSSSPLRRPAAPRLPASGFVAASDSRAWGKPATAACGPPVALGDTRKPGPGGLTERMACISSGLARADRDCLEIGGAGAEAVVSRLISDRG